MGVSPHLAQMVTQAAPPTAPTTVAIAVATVPVTDQPQKEKGNNKQHDFHN
jgi:hypothetical protein